MIFRFSCYASGNVSDDTYSTKVSRDQRLTKNHRGFVAHLWSFVDAINIRNINEIFAVVVAECLISFKRFSNNFLRIFSKDAF